MLIGGQAVLLHRSPRTTEDIDITLGVDPSALPAIEAVCASLRLVPLPEHVESFVNETFVLPARARDGAVRVEYLRAWARAFAKIEGREGMPAQIERFRHARP